MSLVRVWMRQLSGASGAALLVPVAVIGAMGLLALAGGFGSLGGLGQAFAGPAIPGGTHAGSVAPAASGGRAPAAALLSVVTSPAPTLVASAKPGTGAARSGGSTSSGGGRNQGATNGSGGVPTTQPTGSAPPTQGTPTPTSGGPPVTTPRPPPTLVDGVVSLGTSITTKIPGPVGRLATTALEDVGNTVDSILPSNTSSASSAISGVTGAVSSTVSQLQSGAAQLGSGVGNLLHGTTSP